MESIWFPCWKANSPARNSTDCMVRHLPICVLCDDGYAMHCGVMIASLLCHCAEETEIDIYILDDGISFANRERLLSLALIRPFRMTFIPVDALPEVEGPKKKDWPQSLYKRLRLPSILRDLDKVLMLDGDMVILEDPSFLMEVPMEGCWVAGVLDARAAANRDRLCLGADASYVNFGMLVVDLKSLREYGVERLFLKTLKERAGDLKFMDQDALNITLEGHIITLPQRWNSQYLDDRYTPRSADDFKKPAIIHYVTNEKPWLTLSAAPRKSYYIHYLKMTPWFGEWKERMGRELRTCHPWIRRFRKLMRQSFEIHLKKSKRYIRICGITILRDAPHI